MIRISCRKMVQEKTSRKVMRNPAIYCTSVHESVWESNPLGALFKPPDGFEDHGRQPAVQTLSAIKNL